MRDYAIELAKKHGFPLATRRVVSIDKLTPEQESQLRPWADMIISEMLKTGPVDFEEFEEAVRAAYRLSNLSDLVSVKQARSPNEAAMVFCMVRSVLEMCGKASGPPSMGSAMSVLSEVIRRVGEIRWPVGARIRTFPFGETLPSEWVKSCGGMAREVLEEVLEADGVKAAGDPVVYDESLLKDELANVSDARQGGCFWAAHPAQESFFRAICGLHHDKVEHAIVYFAMIMNTGPLMFHERFVIGSERHVEIHREYSDVRETMVLSSHDGLAMSWSDGTGFAAVDGHSDFERKHFDDPSSLTLEDIQNTSNVEVRRILTERYGWDRYLQDSGAEVLDVDHEAHVEQGSAPRALVRDTDGAQYLIGTDGSTGRVYAMPVDPEARTCREAHESICGFSEERIKAKS